jgi:hypothetical protein
LSGALGEGSVTLGEGVSHPYLKPVYL